MASSALPTVYPSTQRSQLGKSTLSTADENVPPFPEHLKNLQKKGGQRAVQEELNWVTRQQPSFRHFLREENIHKNRYPNVVLWDHSRVHLTDDIGEGDYYHASLVDGYKQKNAYCLAQAPMEETVLDFWRMIWHTNTSLIVLLQAVDEEVVLRKDHKGRPELTKNLCAEFWPPTGKEQWYDDGRTIRVRTDNSRPGVDFDTYTVVLSNTKERVPHHLKIVQYQRWKTDDDIPEGLAGFLGKIRLLYDQIEQENGKTEEGGNKAPMTVVCATGVTRSGTLACLDVLFRRLIVEAKADLFETVRLVRHQRYGSVHLLGHYLFLNEAIVNYAVDHGMMEGMDLDLASFALEMRER